MLWVDRTCLTKQWQAKGSGWTLVAKKLLSIFFIMNMFSVVFLFYCNGLNNRLKESMWKSWSLLSSEENNLSSESFPFDFWLTFAYTSDQRSSLWKDTSSTGARSRTSQSPATRAARRPTARRRTRWTWEVSARYRHMMRWWKACLLGVWVFWYLTI